MIRELVLQLKLARSGRRTSARSIASTSSDEFREPARLAGCGGYLETATPDVVALTRQGLLRVDTLLPRFFRPEHGASATPRAPQ